MRKIFSMTWLLPRTLKNILGSFFFDVFYHINLKKGHVFVVFIMQCSKCGVSGQKVKLFDVIAREGIVKVCENCFLSEDHPIIRKPTVFQLREIERKPAVYERLSKMAGLDPRKKMAEKSDYLIKQETNLRAIVDKNYQEKFGNDFKAKPRPDLIDNFHWAIMRARRSKKITRKQLAEEMGEAEAAIKMAEEGILPTGDNNRLLNKIQNHLGINLIKGAGLSPLPAEANPSNVVLEFDRKNPAPLTIADIRRMKEEKEREHVLDAGTEQIKSNQDKSDSGKGNRKNKNDPSDEDIHNLIFKK